MKQSSLKTYLQLFVVICVFAASIAYAEGIECLNDYWATSKEQVLVYPTFNLSELDKEKAKKQTDDYAKFLGQFGQVEVIADNDFNFTSEFDKKVVILIGSEHSNSFLHDNANELLASSSQDIPIELCGKQWTNKDIGAIFLNQFQGHLAVVDYLPDLDFIFSSSYVFQGPTEFVVFNSLCFSGFSDSYLARGYFNKTGGKWTIAEKKFEEMIPDEYVLYVREKKGETALEPGDVLESINGIGINTININKVLDELKDKEKTASLIRDGNKISVKIQDQDINNAKINACPSKMPVFEDEIVKAEFQRIIETFSAAYVDPFDYMKTQAFEKACQTLKASVDKKSLTYIELINRLARFYSSFNDGHAYWNLNDQYLQTEFVLSGKRVFPFQPILVGNELYVPENSFGLPKGGVILQINGRKVSQILNDLSQLFTGDTFAHKLSTISQTDFSDYYYLFYSEEKAFNLQISSEGKTAEYSVKAVPFTQRENRLPQDKEDCVISTPTADLLVLRINSFQGSDEYKQAINTAFEQLEKEGIPNLAIDLRGNGGGSTDVLCLLAEKLISGEYRVYKACRVKRSKAAEDSGHVFGADVPYGEKYPYTVTSTFKGGEKVYSGNLFVITGPKTFSTAFDAAAVLRVNCKAVLVGEPAGGKIIQTGNHFMMNLFKKGIQVSVPYKDFLPAMPTITDYASTSPDAILEPDHLVLANEKTIKNDIDPCVEFIKTYISERKKFDELHQPSTEKSN